MGVWMYIYTRATHVWRKTRQESEKQNVIFQSGEMLVDMKRPATCKDYEIRIMH